MAEIKVSDIQNQEREFREFLDHDKWAPVAFMDYFSKDFIRQMKDKLDLDTTWMRVSILTKGKEFFEEIYGREYENS